MNIIERKSIQRLNRNIPRWDHPNTRSFASLIDHHILAEVLDIAASSPVSATRLISSDKGLGSRLRKLIKIKETSPTSASGLVSLLTRFGWLRKLSQVDAYQLTESGKVIHLLLSEDPKKFRRKVVEELHKQYVIPGWIIERLYCINPGGGGEVVMPSPLRDFIPGKKLLTESQWNKELAHQAVAALEHVQKLIPGSCPIEKDVWLEEVRKSWEALSSDTNIDGSARKHRSSTGSSKMFGVRGRLLHAMREASVALLFGERWSKEGKSDFERPPLSSRASEVWCPRLAELELIFYTDYHPSVAGRILVPCSSFRKQNVILNKEETINCFEPIGIKNPDGVVLSLHQPKWVDFRAKFLKVIVEVYRRRVVQTRARYVSLLAVRDEVCRQLRLSALLFDTFLEFAYNENAAGPLPEESIESISIESDLRLDQRSAIGLNQRPVYINRVPQSLLSLKIRPNQ